MAVDPHERRRARLDKMRGVKSSDQGGPKETPDDLNLPSPARAGLPFSDSSKFLIIAIIIAGGIYFAWDYGRDVIYSVWTGEDPQKVAQIELGRTVYYQHCAYCHGDYLEGQADWDLAYPNGGRPPVPLDISGPAPLHTEDLIYKIIKEGGQSVSPASYRNNMPAYQNVLNEQEIWAVIAFMVDQWPERTQKDWQRANMVMRERLRQQQSDETQTQ